jgi:hypothetical protein
MAVRDATLALTGAEFTPVEPIRRRLRQQAAAVVDAVDDAPGDSPRSGGGLS